MPSLPQMILKPKWTCCSQVQTRSSVPVTATSDDKFVPQNTGDSVTALVTAGKKEAAAVCVCVFVSAMKCKSFQP